MADLGETPPTDATATPTSDPTSFESAFESPFQSDDVFGDFPQSSGTFAPVEDDDIFSAETQGMLLDDSMKQHHEEQQQQQQQQQQQKEYNQDEELQPESSPNEQEQFVDEMDQDGAKQDLEGNVQAEPTVVSDQDSFVRERQQQRQQRQQRMLAIIFCTCCWCTVLIAGIVLGVFFLMKRPSDALVEVNVAPTINEFPTVSPTIRIDPSPSPTTIFVPSPTDAPVTPNPTNLIVQDNNNDFIVIGTTKGNDNCVDAYKLTFGNNGTSTLTLNGSTIDTAVDNQVLACEMVQDIGHGVWYVLEDIESDSLMIASTCRTTTLDTQISIYSGSACEQLSCVATNDQFCGSGGDQSQVAWYARRGSLYYILVHGYRSAVGDFVLDIKQELELNNMCDTAIDIGDSQNTNSDSFALTSVFGSTRGSAAMLFNDDDTFTNWTLPECSYQPTTVGVWYIFMEEYESGGLRRASVETKDSSYSGWILMYTGSCEDLICGDLTSSSSPSNTIEWISQNGVVYYLFVHDAFDMSRKGGDFVLQIQRQESAGPFTATLPPSDLGGLIPSPLFDDDACLDLVQLEFATPVTVDGNTLYNQTTSIFGHTADFLGSCGDSVFITQPGVWYSVMGNGDVIKASTCKSMGRFDTQISIFACTETGGFECIDGNDQAPCGNSKSSISWLSIKNEPYLILVHGYLGYGTFDLSVTSEKLNTLSSVSCETAIGPIPIIDSSPIVGATNEAPTTTGLDTCGSTTDGELIRPAWYKMVGTGEQMTASTCGKDFNVKDSANLAVFEGSCSDNLKCVESRRSKCDYGMTLTWSSKEGTFYYIMVYTSNVDTPFVLTVQPVAINDNCPQASGPLTIDSVTYGSTHRASTDSLDISSCPSVTGEWQGVWYTMLGRGTTVKASTCNPYTNVDTRVMVFSSSLVDLEAAYEDKCTNLSCVSSEISCSTEWLASKGEEYWIFIAGKSSFVGNFALEIAQTLRT